ncbi:MAG: hypothetical protein M3463_02685 [Verrucomicrobiota bacterium]|nr:hypothetical protein [Verrucomicrobiota bacterium]
MMLRTTLLLLAAVLLHTRAVSGQTDPGNFKEVPYHSLTDRTISPLGAQALEIRAADWKHAESANFVYHFFQSFVAAPVSVEAEFYYGIIAKDLEKDTQQWERKCHIFIFEKPEDWKSFQSKASLDPWTGGIHAAGELFIVRNPAYKFKGSTLGHEVAHLVVHRFFGNGISLWLNEGYAEYAASRGYASFHRARGYAARPRAQAIAPDRFIPLQELTGQISYPTDVLKVETFYRESERLVRFLSGLDKRKFGVFFEAMSKGNRFESALTKAFEGRFLNLEALEGEFKTYATKEHGTAIQD